MSPKCWKSKKTGAAGIALGAILALSASNASLRVLAAARAALNWTAYKSMAGGYSFEREPSWTLNEIKADNRSDGVRLSLIQKSKKTRFAGISIQRYRIPYHRLGSGTWKGAQDYLETLKRKTEINAQWSAHFNEKPPWSLSEPQKAGEMPASAASFLKTQFESKDFTSTILIKDRKKDFLVVAYQATPGLYKTHWPDFVRFLETLKTEP